MRVVVALALATAVVAVASACSAGGSRTGARLPGAVVPPGAASGKTTEALGLDLLDKLGRGNLVFSPDSVAVALAMTGTGAAGEAASQMARTLHLRAPADFSSIGALQLTIASEQGTSAAERSEAPKRRS